MSRFLRPAGEHPVQISPSILAADFTVLGEDCRRMAVAGADMLHIDVMDGHFVPNISFGPALIRALKRVNPLFFDVHLMISHPLRYLDDFLGAGADLITFHLECEDDADTVIDAVRKRGSPVGLSVKPGTPAEAVFPYLDRLDLVLVMTVEPGFGGQSFMPDMMPKVGAIAAEIRRRGLQTALQVDGGITEQNAALPVTEGASVLVAGSSLFSKQDYIAAVDGLRRAAIAR